MISLRTLPYGLRTLAAACAVAALALSCLAPRSVEAVTVTVDYSLDDGQFFGAGNPAGAGAQARAAVEAAAGFFSNILTDSLAAIQVPAPFNSTTGSTITWSWTARLFDPATGVEMTITDAAIAADEFRIYAGARPMSFGTLALGGTGGANPPTRSPGSLTAAEVSTVNQITSNFQSAIFDRGEASGFDSWGGSLAFNANPAVAWHYNHLTEPSGLTSDFYSVALHEMAHALGLGTSLEWENYASGALFTGPAASVAYGGMPPLSAPGVNDGKRRHWQSGTLSTIFGKTGTQEAALDPELTQGSRKVITALDAAALKDIGWQVITPPNPADFNADGAVNGGDFNAWKTAFGATANADADGDRDSDGRDFLEWQRVRGLVGAAAAATTVPEPGSAALAPLAWGAWAAGRRRRTYPS